TVRLRKQGAGAHAAMPAVSHSLSGLPVLVVDDNATNRRILEEVLKNWRMRATTVTSAEAALKALANAVAEGRPFAVALLDGHMPEVDGFELARRITKDTRYAGLRLV